MPCSRPPNFFKPAFSYLSWDLSSTFQGGRESIAEEVNPTLLPLSDRQTSWLLTGMLLQTQSDNFRVTTDVPLLESLPAHDSRHRGRPTSPVGSGLEPSWTGGCPHSQPLQDREMSPAGCSPTHSALLSGAGVPSLPYSSDPDRITPVTYFENSRFFFGGGGQFSFFFFLNLNKLLQNRL